MNKSSATNLLAILAMAAGWGLQLGWLWTMGLFAFSGAVTNWLAVHMLFEKVPLLYGSGVIPARFAELKQALYQLMMQQFFSQDTMQRLLTSQHQQDAAVVKLGPVLDNVDWSPAFDALLETVQKSSFGGMLAMFGGAQVLVPLKQPFIDNLKQAILQIADSPQVQQQLLAELQQAEQLDMLRAKVSTLVQARLDELTPELVKQLIQQLIQQHLGWLVVWGGVFGAVIGALSTVIGVTPF